MEKKGGAIWDHGFKGIIVHQHHGREEELQIVTDRRSSKLEAHILNHKQEEIRAGELARQLRVLVASTREAEAGGPL